MGVEEWSFRRDAHAIEVEIFPVPRFRVSDVVLASPLAWPQLRL